MERRVEKTEGNRFCIHYFHSAFHSAFDVWLKFSEGCLALFVCLGKNHLAEFCKRSLRILAVEHVLDTEQSDSLCTEADCALCILRGVGVGANTHLAELVHDVHELHETWVVGSIHSVEGGVVNQTLCTVEADHIAFLDLNTAGLEPCSLVLKVNLHCLAAYDAAFAPSACNECSV